MINHNTSKEITDDQQTTYSKLADYASNDIDNNSTNKPKRKKQTTSSNKTPVSAADDNDDEVTEGIAAGFKKSWLIPYSDLQFDKEIGSGAFGIVFVG